MVSSGSGGAAARGALPWRAIIVAVIALIAVTIGLIWIFSDKDSTTTDDAYVRADESIVSPLVHGMVTEVLVRENQPVKVGDPLVRLDPEEYDLAIRNAQGDLMAADAAAKAAKAGLARLDAEEKLSEDQVKGAQALAGAAGAKDPALRQAFETARGQALIAVRSRGEIEADLSQAEAAQYRANTELAAANAEKAHTLIVAGAAGVAADVAVVPGAVVQPGVKLMTIVSQATPYLTANFKETQVGRMRAGQAASVTVDAAPGLTFTGHVDSLAPGSGSEFALLPFEPGTGNFTKIVQRVPVRIVLDPDQKGLDRLRPGLSAEVTVRLKAGG